MALTKEQIAEAKKQLEQQVQNLPDQQKAAALEQIKNMSDEAIETLVKQSQAQNPSSGKGIFRMIIDGDVQSVKAGENAHCLAVMDINPISEGHVMIIPKKAITDSKNIPTQCFTLGKALAKKITSKLKASKAELHTENKFGESIIHVLPEYDSPVSLSSPRAQSKKEDLESLAKKINPPKKAPVIKKKTVSKTQDSAIPKLKRRIP